MLSHEQNNSWTSTVFHHSACEKPSRTVTPELISLTQNFVQNLCKTAPNLREFVAENHFIDGSQVSLY